MTLQRARSPWRGPLVAAGVVGLLAGVSFWIDTSPYRWALGAAEPAVAVAVLIALSVPALVLLDRSGLFAFSRRRHRRRALCAATTLAVMFAALVVLVDVVIGFPQTYDVPPQFPQSLFFFTVIGYVAETTFHVLPLLVIVMIIARLASDDTRERLLRLAMVAVACVEPIFQARLGIADVGFSYTWLELFVLVHVFAINLVQLGLYRQFDFLAAYAFRLVYYLLWHVVWGLMRQAWLF